MLNPDILACCNFNKMRALAFKQMKLNNEFIAYKFDQVLYKLNMVLSSKCPFWHIFVIPDFIQQKYIHKFPYIHYIAVLVLNREHVFVHTIHATRAESNTLVHACVHICTCMSKCVYVCRVKECLHVLVCKNTHTCCRQTLHVCARCGTII